MSFLFKYYSLVEVIYLLIRWNKWNTNNNRNGVNKQNKHRPTGKSMKKGDTPFLKQPPYFTNPSLFTEKIEPPIFVKISKSWNSFFIKELQYSFYLSVWAVWFFYSKPMKNNLCQWLLQPLFTSIILSKA